MKTILIVLTAMAVCAPAAGRTGQGATETFGAEANPTGSPIGGGKGYARPIARGDYRVKTAAALIAALKKATRGQVVFIEGEAEIDLTAGVRDGLEGRAAVQQGVEDPPADRHGR